MKGKRTVGIAILLAVVAAGSAQPDDDPWRSVPDRPRPLREAAVDTAWMAGAAALDLGTTRYALARCPGCYEANPMMQSTGKALATKAVATAAGGLICYELRRHGHTREAKWFRWGIVALWSGLAVNAMVQAR